MVFQSNCWYITICGVQMDQIIIIIIIIIIINVTSALYSVARGSPRLPESLGAWPWVNIAMLFNPACF